MSKKRVEEALVLVEQNMVDAALAKLAGVDPDYVEKRLRHLLGRADFAESASRLWSALGVGVLPDVSAAVVEPVTEPSLERPLSKALPRYVSLDKPTEFLASLADGPASVTLNDTDLVEVWALAALAALARRSDDESDLDVAFMGTESSGARFAAAVGLSEVIANDVPSPGEPGRTVKLRRVRTMQELEAAAQSVALLALPNREDEEERRTIKYVVLELLRNAVQHSGDRLGGVVAAQRMDVGYSGRTAPAVQVAVADRGVGIQAALSATHPDVDDPLVAITKALEPHISGTFEQGRTGSKYNAGMGLFFIAEMTKLTAGKLLIATRGATVTLDGDPTFNDKHDMKHLHGVAFAGTLVTFELPLGSVADYDAIIQTITERARERTPKRVTQHWLTYDNIPSDTQSLLVHHIAEDTVEAHATSKDVLIPRLVKRTGIALDFRDVEICTQSFLHALLYEALRIAWALQVPVYVSNAAPAVRSGLSLVENYALGG